MVKPPKAFTFYIGSHRPHWLWTRVNLPDCPLFISRATLGGRVNYRDWSFRKWALDSAAFMELVIHGRWTVSARDYADECLVFAEDVGLMQFCAIQDWMCEEGIIKGGRVGKLTAKGTKLSVLEHQKRTVASYCDLMAMEPELPWLPVLQGYTLEDYLRCIEMYRAAGVGLSETLVGVGSVCRREATDEIAEVFSRIVEAGVPHLHGFGVKTGGIEKSVKYLKSADSMAWSFQAMIAHLRADGCKEDHKVCNNCPNFASQWYYRTIKPAIERGFACLSCH